MVINKLESLLISSIDKLCNGPADFYCSSLVSVSSITSRLSLGSNNILIFSETEKIF